MRETTITTDKNNFVFPPRKPRSDRGDVVFTSCSRCFPIDTQAIRNKILDLAIRGKLTEQLPEDGSAEELYRQIQKEKQTLVKAGKIKKEKPLSEITVDEEPFGIPENWYACHVSDINFFVPETTNPLNNPETIYELFSVPVFFTGQPEILKGERIASTKQLLQENDVLVCKINPRINRVWRVTKHTDFTLIGSSEWIPFRNSKLDAQYMCYYFQSPFFRLYMLSNLTGVGGSLTRAKPEKFKRYPVFLPPLAEQHRIVERIDQAFSILDTIDALQAQYADNLTVLKSKLLEAAIQGKLVPRGPEPWKTVKLGDIAESVNVGIVIRPTRYYVPPGEGTPAFRNCNIRQGAVDDGELVWLNADAARENPRAVVKTGDILIARSGTPGNCCIVPEACDGWGAVDIVIVRLRQDLADPRYVKAFICSPTAQKAFLSMSRGVALSHLGATAVASLPISLPPLDEQRCIAAKLEALLSLCEGQKR